MSKTWQGIRRITFCSPDTDSNHRTDTFSDSVVPASEQLRIRDQFAKYARIYKESVYRQAAEGKLNKER